MCQAEKGPELTAPAAPEASEPETELLAEAKAAGLFLDRELSWLQFNRRVLEQAGDPTVPLLERLKFLGIYRSNLEEFFMVRVGSLTHRAALLPDERDEKTGCTPGEQVSAILAAVAAQQPREERIYRRLLEDMRDAGIDVLDFHKMTKPEEVVAKKYFSELRPLLSPRVVDGGHPFPFIANREIYMAATIGKGDDFRLGLVSLLRLPPWRVVELDGRQKVMLTAELVRHFVPQLFKKQEVRDAVLLQVTRNADVFIDDDLRGYDADFRASMEKMLRKRKRQQPVRLVIGGKPSARLRAALIRDLKVSESNVFTTKLPFDLSFGSGVKKAPGMKYRHYAPKAPVTVVRGNPQDTAKYIAAHIGDSTGVLCFDEYKNMFPNCIVECFGSQDDLGAQAREVFDRLRAFDDTSVTQIWAQCPSDEGLGLAVANRIKKAAGFSVIEI